MLLGRPRRCGGVGLPGLFGRRAHRRYEGRCPVSCARRTRRRNARASFLAHRWRGLAELEEGEKDAPRVYLAVKAASLVPLSDTTSVTSHAGDHGQFASNALAWNRPCRELPASPADSVVVWQCKVTTSTPQSPLGSARPVTSRSSLSACNARPVHTDGPGWDKHEAVWFPGKSALSRVIRLVTPFRGATDAGWSCYGWRC